jgi:hypothetical protein
MNEACLNLFEADMAAGESRELL